MLEQMNKDLIGDSLNGEVFKIASGFFDYLIKSDFQFERGKGYWENKLYWMIKYKNEYVCFVLLNGGEDKTEPCGWVVWSDDSGSDWFNSSTLDEHTKEIAWKHVDICRNCNGCKKPGGIHKTIFGRVFDNVCITTFRFDNPDGETTECVKKLMELRKIDILENVQ